MIQSGLGKGVDVKSVSVLAPPESTRFADEASASAPSELDQLRDLLFGAELRELEHARTRLAALETSQEKLPERLPPALEAVNAAGEAPRVARALARPVASALAAAVRENRQTVIDTLFPVIGPLIRKAITEALRNLIIDLNGAIESSFTPRGLIWRLEAWRAGVPYAQVVLKHRLAYQIDHVFLIARDSGLVLQHESAPDLQGLDADAIAGMLTAIGDFVGDSVARGSGDTLESARVGEYLVWVMQGPRANLACFIRGVPPQALRSLLERRLEEIHAQLAGMPLERASRDPALAATWHDSLQPPALLREIGADASASPRAQTRWPLLLILLAFLIALAAYFVRHERWDARVETMRARLQALPGFVLTSIDTEPWRKIRVQGLLDPDADSPRDVLEHVERGDVRPEIVTTGYLSADDVIVARRVQRVLVPPTSVHAAVAAGVLKLDGHADASWIAAARERAGWVAGVRRVDMSVTTDTNPIEDARAHLVALAREISSLQIAFSDADVPAADAQSGVDRIADMAMRAIGLAAQAHRHIDFTCVGSNDEIGTDEANRRVREARARWLVDALAARGVGDRNPLAVGEDAVNNRRSAYLRVNVTADPP